MPTALHLVCPHCQATNRLPNTRLTEKPRCGQCRQALFNGSPTNLSSAAFAKQLANSDIPLLVDFWAAWCGPCQMMAPQFTAATAQLEPHMRLAKIDTEAEAALSAQLAIRSIPTLILFKNGKEIARHAGAMSAADIVHWTQQHR